MSEEVIVETASGKLRGISLGRIKSFKGIPYAAPPEGARRFMPPVAAAPWAGVRDAFDFGPRALQDENALGLPDEVRALMSLSGYQPMRENCLMLNVWTPQVNDGGKRPVELPGGETRAFLEDGDEVILRARCERPGRVAIGFGEAAGTIRRASAP